MPAQGISTADEGRAASGVSAWAARHPLMTFYLMAFGFAWLLWIPFLTLSRGGIGLLPFTAPVLPLTILGSFAGPTLAAFIMTSILQGRAGVMHLLRRYVRFRAPAVW